MALTATASRGFEFDRYVSPDEILMLPGNPGDTYAPGDSVDFTNGVLSATTAGDTPLYQVVAGSPIVCPSATSYGFGVYGLDTGFFEGSIDGGMAVYIPCRPLRPQPNTPVMKCTFKNHHDDTVVSWTPSTRTLVLTVSPGANDDGNGGILYVYEGAGIGQWNIAEDFTHAGISLVLHRTFETALDATSKIVWLDGATTDTVGIGFGSRINAADEDELNAADGGDDGEWAPVLDVREVPELLKILMMKVVPALTIA